MVVASTAVQAEPAPAGPGTPPSGPGMPGMPVATSTEPGPPPGNPVASPVSHAPEVAPPVAPAEPVLVEACDGSRQRATQEPSLLPCRRWSIAWQEGGTPWGLVTASTYDGVLAERERQLGFARQHARFFEVPLDERYTEPSPAICETCEAAAPVGRWGEGQKFGDAAARQALTATEAEHAALDAALHEHLPRLTDAARLARDPAVAKAARAYARTLRQSVLQLAKGRLALDDAAMLRSEPLAKDAGRAATAHVEALASALVALRTAVAKEVGKAHAGRYLEEGAPGPDGPHLEIEIEGTDVKAVYATSGAQSTWFEGTVDIDGSLAGRSLLAPEQGALSCSQHAEACGYVYIPSVLRFTERATPEGKTLQTAELWFQRSAWVMAKPFSRPAR
jgi:hypothetical protein